MKTKSPTIKRACWKCLLCGRFCEKDDAFCARCFTAIAVGIGGRVSPDGKEIVGDWTEPLSVRFPDYRQWPDPQ